MNLIEYKACEIGNRVRARRIELGVSFLAFAKRAKLSKALLSKIENGKALNPTLHTLMSLAYAADMNVSALLKDTTQKQKESR